jgi:hypothetical protein
MPIKLKPHDLIDFHIDRVVVDPDGRATTPERARRDYGITPDIVFERDDGWRLGAPSVYKNIAEDMWKDEWQRVYVIEKETTWSSNTVGFC